MSDRKKDYDPNRDLIISTLMQEYVNTHNRVTNMVKNYESNHLKVLILLGLLLYYSIDNFFKANLNSYIINGILIFVIPFFTTVSITLTVTHEPK